MPRLLQPHSQMTRRRPSLHLGSTPIPPSLLSSPFLTSPIFGQEVVHSHLPTEQDELWLQDTIPLSPTSSGSSGSLAARDSALKRPPQNITRPALHSPPIIVNHHSPPRSRDRSNTQPPPYSFTHPRDLHCPVNAHSLHPPADQASSASSIAHPSPPQTHLLHTYPYTVHTRPCTWASSHTRKHSDSDLPRLIKAGITVGTGVSAARDSQRERSRDRDRESGASPSVPPLR